jgi:hypothetical protein
VNGSGQSNTSVNSLNNQKQIASSNFGGLSSTAAGLAAYSNVNSSDYSTNNATTIAFANQSDLNQIIAYAHPQSVKNTSSMAITRQQTVVHNNSIKESSGGFSSS